MNLKDARDLYYYYSGKTSDLVRQLGLAGIAVIWLFKYDAQGVPKVPEALALPLILIVLGLALDLLQYAVATSIWGVFQRQKEKSSDGKKDPDFLAPKQFNWPTVAFFTTKAIAIIAAYVYLLLYLAATVL
jgi:hypothetical protein